MRKSTKDHDGLVNEIVERFNRHDLGGVVACYSPNTWVTSPLYPEPIELLEHTFQLQRIFRAFPDIRLEPELIVRDGRRVVTEFSLTATHLGTLTIPGESTHAATERPIAIRGRLIHEFDNLGLIVSEEGFWDTESLLDQLGIELIQQPSFGRT